MMTGLSLINTYCSDSEDDERETENSSKLCKLHNRLPLPKSIVTWEGVSHHEEVIDDPSLHNGRMRSFKHERGNWASLTYLQYIPSDGIEQWVFSASKRFPFKCNVFSQEFHVSVSKTLILKFHWIEPFVNDLKKLCERTNRFVLEFSSLQTYCNEEKTRTFVSAGCFDRTGTLDRFVKELDNLLAEYGLPTFYEDKSYHASLFWCLGDERTRMNAVLESLNCDFTEFLANHNEENYFSVNEVHFKTGNKSYAFSLV